MSPHNGSAVPGGADALGRHTTPRNGHEPHGVAAARTRSGAADTGTPDPLELERARLEAEIEAAIARKAAATGSEDERNATLHAVVVRMQAELADMEARHVDALAAIRIATDAEIARISASAERTASRDVHPATGPIDSWDGGAR